jgi:hypothetical protein
VRSGSGSFASRRVAAVRWRCGSRTPRSTPANTRPFSRFKGTTSFKRSICAPPHSHPSALCSSRGRKRSYNSEPFDDTWVEYGLFGEPKGAAAAWSGLIPTSRRTEPLSQPLCTSPLRWTDRSRGLDAGPDLNPRPPNSEPSVAKSTDTKSRMVGSSEKHQFMAQSSPLVQHETPRILRVGVDGLGRVGCAAQRTWQQSERFTLVATAAL